MMAEGTPSFTEETKAMCLSGRDEILSDNDYFCFVERTEIKQ